MNTTLLLKGLIMGFSIAAPVGPIGLLCIQRTLAQGRAYGLLSGLGAATADATYGMMAAFGLTFVTAFLTSQQTWVRLFGGLFLVYLGIRTALARPAARSASVQGKGLAGAYGSTLLLTLANPMTILSFVGVFAGLGIGGTEGYASAALLVVGVFLGSAAWWLLLSSGVSILRDKLRSRETGVVASVWINRVSGLVITAFGLWALISLMR